VSIKNAWLHVYCLLAELVLSSKTNTRFIKSCSFYCYKFVYKTFVQETLDGLLAHWHCYYDCWHFLLILLLFLFCPDECMLNTRERSRRILLHLWCMKNFAPINVWTIWQFYGEKFHQIHWTSVAYFIECHHVVIRLLLYESVNHLYLLSTRNLFYIRDILKYF